MRWALGCGMSALSCQINSAEKERTMNSYEKNRLLVHVAKLYYENEYSQEQIAQEMQLSRPYVSKLLQAAKKAGIVRIQIVDPLNTENSLETRIRQRFGLEKVIVVPSTAEAGDLHHVSEAAARFLNTVLTDETIIGTSWGDTLYHVSCALNHRTDLRNITYVQLCGGVSNVNSAVHASEIANNFSKKTGSTSFLMPIPAVVGSRETKKMLENDVNIKKVLLLGCKADIAMFTIGAFGVDGRRSALVREGYLDEEQTRLLTEKGAVGDICCHMINADGELCDMDLDARTMAISLDEIAGKKLRIGVAQGVSKEASIFGALKSGIMNVLITNEKTAAAIIER